MKLTILGSGCCLPAKAHSHAAYVLSVGNRNYLLECGPGSLTQLENAGIDYRTIDTFFISHLHPDHINEFPAFLLAAQNDSNLIKKKYIVYGPKGFKKFYKTLLKLYPSINKKNFKVKIKESGNSKFRVGKLNVQTLTVRHLKGSIGFRFEAKKKILAFSGDSGSCKELVRLAQNAELFLCECFDLYGRMEDFHLSPAAAGLIAHLANVKKLVLTHFLPEATPEKLKQQASMFFRKKIVIAKDFMTFNKEFH